MIKTKQELLNHFSDINEMYNNPFKYQTLSNMIDELLEQQPCEDCISREVVKDMLTAEWTKYMPMELDINLSFVLDKISALPSVTPSYNSVKTELEQTRPHGEWILLDECANSGYYCSVCSKKLVKEGWSDTVKKIKFCPNCGAKMEVEDEDSN